MRDREFYEYTKERDGRKDFRSALEEYFGTDTKEPRQDRIPLQDGCSWVRMDDGSGEGW